uniref:Peptidoglycan-binding domain 1 protein n=1 Tax=Solibacter usitatus (strain Ellin6076) TaxID=234267 RepID=Q01PN1_SOLUE
MADFVGASTPISAGGLDQATQLLGSGAAEIWTVLEVETKGFGYLPDRRPAILFERHFFHRLTCGRFDDQAPEISCSMPGGYLGGAKEYDRLAQAIALDRHAALSSASWGIGQIMGSNFAEAGFASVESMVSAMVQSEDGQLTAMARFVCSTGLGKPLASHDWEGFAKGYNGPSYARNQYDILLARHYQMFAAGPLPDIRVRQAQAILTFLDIDPGGVDGMIGKRTRAAVAQFRAANCLGNSDQIDDALIAALTAKLVCTTSGN